MFLYFFYFQKMNMDIIIGSEYAGIWGRKVIDYLLNKINYTNITYKNCDECNFIIISHNKYHNHIIEPIWNTNKKKYIIWSGEPFFPDEINQNATNKLYIGNICNKYILNKENYIYIPFCLYSNHIYKNRKYENKNRKYFLAYCNTIFTNEREDMFDLFVKKKGGHLCHSLGECCGSFKETKIKKIDGDFMNEDLIDCYKDYKFVIAMENECKDGYVTEKIINAFYSGAIPIYWGSNNINDFFNPESFINVNNFDSFEDCVDYVTNMTDDEIQYMSKQNIYQNNDLINLINNDYNSKNDNKILKKYYNIMHAFLNDEQFNTSILQITTNLEVSTKINDKSPLKKYKIIIIKISILFVFIFFLFSKNEYGYYYWF